MPFPISRTGSITVPPDADVPRTPEHVLARTREALAERGADRFVERDGRLHFRSPFRWLPPGGSWNILAPISRGWVAAEVRGSGICLRYHLRYTRLVTVASGMVFAVLAVVVLTSSVGDSEPWLLVVLWLWLCGVNYLISIIRFPGFLRWRLRSEAQRRGVPSMEPPWAPGKPPRFPRD